MSSRHKAYACFHGTECKLLAVYLKLCSDRPLSTSTVFEDVAGRIFMALPGRPSNDPTWPEVERGVGEGIASAAAKMHFYRCKHCKGLLPADLCDACLRRNPRGVFDCMELGMSYGGGQTVRSNRYPTASLYSLAMLQVPMNFAHPSTQNQVAIQTFLQNQHVIRAAGFASSKYLLPLYSTSYVNLPFRCLPCVRAQAILPRLEDDGSPLHQIP